MAVTLVGWITVQFQGRGGSRVRGGGGRGGSPTRLGWAWRRAGGGHKGAHPLVKNLNHIIIGV